MPRPKRKQPPQWDDVFLEVETPKPRKTKRTTRSRQATKSNEAEPPITPEPHKVRGNLEDEVDELAAPPTVKKPPARKAATARAKAPSVPTTKTEGASAAPRRRGRAPKNAPPEPAVVSSPTADSSLSSNDEATGKALTNTLSDSQPPLDRPIAVTRGRGRGRSRGTSRGTQSTRAVKARVSKPRSSTPADDSEGMLAEVSVTIDPLLRRSSPIPSPPLSPSPAQSPLASAAVATRVPDNDASTTTAQGPSKTTRLKAIATPARRTRASLTALTKHVETPATAKRTQFARLPASDTSLRTTDEGVVVDVSASDDDRPKELTDSPQTPTRLRPHVKTRPPTKVPHFNGHRNSPQSLFQTTDSQEALVQARQRIAELEKKYDNLRALRVTEAERVLTMYKQSAEERFSHAEALLTQLQEERDALAHQVTTLQADLASQAASQASASQQATEALVAKVQQLETELCCTKSRMEDLETHRRLSQTHTDYTLREKLKLYATLTGLSIDDVITADEGVQFQCAQTGKTGILKYTLTIFDDDPESIQYDAVPVEPSDAKSGQFATALPDYLLDTICFQQDVAPMFFTRTVNALQGSAGSTQSSDPPSDIPKPSTDD